MNVFLTDPPFGKQHGDSATVRSLYPAMLAEMRRAVAPCGALVMLCPTRHWRFFCSLVLPLRDQSGEAGAAWAPHPASLAVWRAGTVESECCCWSERCLSVPPPRLVGGLGGPAGTGSPSGE